MTYGEVIILTKEIVESYLGINFWVGTSDSLQEDPHAFPLVHLDPPPYRAGSRVFSLRMGILHKLEVDHNESRKQNLIDTAIEQAYKFIDGVEDSFTDRLSLLDMISIDNDPEIIPVPDFRYSGSIVCGCRFEVNLSVVDLRVCTNLSDILEGVGGDYNSVDWNILDWYTDEEGEN